MTGDRARVSVAVGVPPSDAFAVFTGEIDRWWRRGARFRNAGPRRGVMHLEPRVDGRLFESIDAASAPIVVEIGRVLVWDPPRRVSFTWRASNFAPHEVTQVEVEFTPQRSGTLVTVTHSGFAALRDDHPVRHGLAGSAFCAEMGRWWGELMASLRESVAAGPDRPPE